MRRVLLVAWREFKHTALTKAFVFGAVVVPLVIMCFFLVVPFLFRPNVTPLAGRVIVVDSDGQVAQALEGELSPARMRERVSELIDSMGDGLSGAKDVAEQAMIPLVELDVERAEAGADVEELKEQVRTGGATALVVFGGRPEGAATEPVLTIFVGPDLPPNHARLIRNAAREAVVRARVAEAGHDYGELTALLDRPREETRTLTKEGTEATAAGELGMFIPMAFMMLIWVSVFTSSQYLLTTTIEEKSNKVIEVLLSAVSPMELMTGKILGQALVSAVMLAMYAGLGIAALVYFSYMHLVPLSHLVYLALYFIMAYFMIASMMAGIGSAVNEMREAQSLIAPAMLILMVPMFLWFPIQENPNGMLATVTSFIPPLIPFVMILRVTSATEPVTTIQIVLTLSWGYFCMFGMIWGAAKVFRVGVLMYGKPPSPLELIRWVRYR